MTVRLWITSHYRVHERSATVPYDVTKSPCLSASSSVRSFSFVYDDRPSDERAAMDRLHEFDFCRLCSRRPETNGNAQFLNILNTKVNRVELRKIILDLLTVSVEEHDLLPKIICLYCHRFLVKWFVMKKKLRIAEAILKKNRGAPENLSDYAKTYEKKKKRLIILQRHLCKKTTENQLIMLNILEKINEFKKQEETQNPPKSVATRGDIEPIDPNEPCFCICNQGEYGRMIACDNEECPYKWFHYDCMNIVKTPKGKWHCHHCVISSIK